MPGLARRRERALDQRPADAAVLEGGIDGERPEHERVGAAGLHRGQAHRADEQRADERRERQIEQMRRALAQPEGGAREAAGPEGALVQPLDRIGVAGKLGANDERKRGHGGPSGTRKSAAREASRAVVARSGEGALGVLVQKPAP